MKRINELLDRLLPWRVKIRHLEERVVQLRVQLGVTEQELMLEREAARLLNEAHAQNKKGVGVLLQFITRTARLNVPATEGSIREALNRGQQNEK